MTLKVNHGARAVHSAPVLSRAGAFRRRQAVRAAARGRDATAIASERVATVQDTVAIATVWRAMHGVARAKVSSAPAMCPCGRDILKGATAILGDASAKARNVRMIVSVASANQADHRGNDAARRSLDGERRAVETVWRRQRRYAPARPAIRRLGDGPRSRTSFHYR